MNLKCTIAVLTALLSVTLSFPQRIHCPKWKCEFQPREQVYVFGNNVKLRTAPDMDSEVLELLKIGEWVEIIESTNDLWPYKGINSPYYKVKYNDITGYVLGGLLSLEKKTLDGTDYFFAYSKEGEKAFLNIRTLHHGQLFQKKIPLANINISIEIYGNFDIEHLDGIIFINYHLGEDSDNYGGIYVFAFEAALIAYELSQFDDVIEHAYYSEKFIFPNEDNGIPGKIIFKKEEGSDLDEEREWIYSNEETFRLRWTGAELVPNFRKETYKLRNRVHQ